MAGEQRLSNAEYAKYIRQGNLDPYSPDDPARNIATLEGMRAEVPHLDQLSDEDLVAKVLESVPDRKSNLSPEAASQAGSGVLQELWRGAYEGSPLGLAGALNDDLNVRGVRGGYDKSRMVGRVAGGIASALIPFGAAAKAGQALAWSPKAIMAARALGQAGLSAASDFNVERSQQEQLRDAGLWSRDQSNPEYMAIQAALGAATGGIGNIGKTPARRLLFGAGIGGGRAAADIYSNAATTGQATPDFGTVVGSAWPQMILGGLFARMGPMEATGPRQFGRDVKEGVGDLLKRDAWRRRVAPTAGNAGAAGNVGGAPGATVPGGQAAAAGAAGSPAPHPSNRPGPDDVVDLGDLDPAWNRVAGALTKPGLLPQATVDAILKGSTGAEAAEKALKRGEVTNLGVPFDVAHPEHGRVSVTKSQERAGRQHALVDMGEDMILPISLEDLQRMERFMKEAGGHHIQIPPRHALSMDPFGQKSISIDEGPFAGGIVTSLSPDNKQARVLTKDRKMKQVPVSQIPEIARVQAAKAAREEANKEIGALTAHHKPLDKPINLNLQQEQNREVARQMAAFEEPSTVQAPQAAAQPAQRPSMTSSMSADEMRAAGFPEQFIEAIEASRKPKPPKRTRKPKAP